ncbi:MAG: SBBP repeat-containing protein, partial [Ilumatobacteraceae bacterium]
MATSCAGRYFLAIRNQRRATAFFVALCLLLVGGVTLLGAAQRTTAWSSADNQVAVLGGTSDEVVNGIAVDGSGNVLLTGSFQGTADFDPGSGTESITSLGSNDVFVVKLNSSGQLVWAKSVGGTGNDQGAAVAVDDSGNVYVAGSFSGTADFDPDSGFANVSAVGFEDGFVMKLDADGAYQWAKQIGGTGPEYARGVAVDSSGNVFTTGYFQGLVDFDPGSANSTLASAGVKDAFLQKLDSDGNYDWAIRLGSAANDEGYSVTTDISDNVLVHGIFQGTVDFDPGAGADSRTTTGSYAAYILKLDTSGGFVWVSVFVDGTSSVFSSSRGKSIAVDGSDNVYTTGYFDGTADFDPSAGSSNLTSAGNWDVYVTKLDSSGALQWAKALGGSMDDYGRSIAVDGSGNVYTTGEFNDSADFDPGPGSSILSSPGGTDDLDVFVSKLNSSGSFVWAKSFVGTDAGCSPYDSSCYNYSEDASGIGTDSSGNVYTSGYFSYPVDFDPGTGTDTLSSAGGSDVFLVKMSAAGVTAVTTTTTPSSSDSSGPRVPGQVPPWPEAVPNVDGTVTVSWAEPFQDGAGPITEYRVVARPQPNSVGQASDSSVAMASGGSCSTTGLICLIAGLDENVDYLFEVFASNSEGEGPGRLTQQTIRIAPQTPETTVPD